MMGLAVVRAELGEIDHDGEAPAPGMHDPFHVIEQRTFWCSLFRYGGDH
jgi:hypothetical protein